MGSEESIVTVPEVDDTCFYIKKLGMEYQMDLVMKISGLVYHKIYGLSRCVLINMAAEKKNIFSVSTELEEQSRVGGLRTGLEHKPTSTKLP